VIQLSALPPKTLDRPYGHFRRNPAPAVHQFRERSARDFKRGRSLRDGQAQRFNALAQYKAARMKGIFIGMM